jgi:allophanate hydrolase
MHAGRVPAHFCGCVGIKPTVGKVSSTGIVRACRALDCASVFARSVPDAALVLRIMEVGGPRLIWLRWPPRPSAEQPHLSRA